LTNAAVFGKVAAESAAEFVETSSQVKSAEID
jgi:succinate dehydrogenase/fumarate reductase flavoprotein subunit